jgi:micrococcal nuclease
MTPHPPAKLTASERRRRMLLRRALGPGIAVLIVLAGILLDRSGMLPTRSRPDRSDAQARLTDAQRQERIAEDLERYDGKRFYVTYVVDGDTLDIDCKDGLDDTTRIRLWGVDTPETVKEGTPVQHFGPEASEFAKKYAQGKTVKLALVDTETRDRHGRLLAYVTLPDGRMLNRVLIETGHGYADPRFPHPRQREFQGLMETAHNARVGLWKSVTFADLPYYLRRD